MPVGRERSVRLATTAAGRRLASTFPVFLVLIILGAVNMKGNPFFTQLRPGKNEKIFRLIKFRTMTNQKDKEGNLLPDDVRLTKYGNFLRSTSLDELPELLNIVVGERGIIETTKNNADFSRVVTVNSISL